MIGRHRRGTVTTTARATAAAAALALLLAAGCSSTGRVTSRDKTTKGAAAGAAAGAIASVLLGEREADEILAGAAIGAAVGAGVGAYMDAQEEKLGHIPGTTVERVADDALLVRFSSDVLFAVDSAILAAGAHASLDEVARVINEYPKTAVVVQGFTDSTGGEQHNLELSERRARAVMSYLVGRGVDAGRITALGYGEDHPVASNDTPSGRQLNRRVGILLKAKAR